MRTLLERSLTLATLSLGALLLASCDPLPVELPDGSVGKVCAGLLGLRCEPGTFCNFPRAAQCGAADQTGTCQLIPEACDLIYAPVCGCDDRSYGNECAAHAAGVSAASSGPCESPAEDAGNRRDAGDVDAGPAPGLDAGPVPEDAAPPASDAATRPDAAAEDAGPAPIDAGSAPDAGPAPVDAGPAPDAGPARDAGPAPDAGSARVCGGWSGQACAKGEFCDYGAACNDLVDASGVCRAVPTVCPDIYAPVCGCNGTTFGNRCEAHSQGIPILHDGECRPAAGRTCGGIAALDCDPGQFCNYEPPRGQGCDGTVADAAGVCELTPGACTLQYDPVCGCDGITYGNACAAHSAGMSVARRGACETRRVSCDRRALLCKRAEPVCGSGQVASIVGTCFGPCVPIEQCSCDEAADCPFEERFTCHLSRGVCGPYVR